MNIYDQIARTVFQYLHRVNYEAWLSLCQQAMGSMASLQQGMDTFWKEVFK